MSAWSGVDSERTDRVQIAVDEAKLARRRWKAGIGTLREFGEAAKKALGELGSLLEDEYHDEEGQPNALRAEFGLGPAADMPWDGVAELVGWTEYKEAIGEEE